MSKWPQSANRVLSIVSGFPRCCVCAEPAERFVSVQWGLGHTSDHPVCAEHLRQYHVDFPALAAELRKLARVSRNDGAGIGEFCR